MDPVFLKLGPITIYWYGFMMAVAVSVGLTLLIRQAAKQGYDKDTFLDLGILVVVSGIIGSRILYVLLNIKLFIDQPLEIFMVHHGGLAVLGAFFVAPVAALIFVKKKNVSFLNAADLIMPFIALGHALGRIGCFLNGCCQGIVCIYGVFSPVHNQVLIPTQLISSLALLILFIILRTKQDKPHIEGSIFLSYIIYYSAFRFCIEFLRGDSPGFFLNLTIFQYICIVSFLLGLAFKLRLKWKNKTSK
ncbi:prolipoprotein diacylglyceryl transferase [Thermoproteota archaeon]